MRKMMILLLSLSLLSCAHGAGKFVGMPSPIVETPLEELPISLRVPEGALYESSCVISGTISQVEYSTGEHECTLRGAKITEGLGDISGVYYDFPIVRVVHENGVTKTLKQRENGDSLFLWDIMGVRYSLWEAKKGESVT